MLKKITYSLFSVAIAVIFGYAGVQFSSQAPTGYTGANGQYCTSCHGGSLNSGGGSVTASGLPSGNFTAGTQYDFSINIAHGTADRRRWGFSISARNSAGNIVGTFSSTNPNATVSVNELVHNGAVTQGPQSAYTYSNLRWTAPASPGPSDNQVTFYYTANAANGDGSSGGDFIYAGSNMVALPIDLVAFNAEVRGTSVFLKWQTKSESNSSHFIIEKSSENQHFAAITKLNAAGSSADTRHYSFTDDKPSYFERATFYRLALVDKDGSKKYSRVVSVVLKSKNTFVKKLYPNPVKAGGAMQVEIISDKQQEISIELIGINGRRFKQQQQELVKGQNIITLNINKFTTAGVYVLLVKMQEVTQQIPLLIQ